MIFWNNLDTHEIIDERSLDELAKENKTPLNEFTEMKPEINDWFNFAHIVATKNNLNLAHETCFIYYVTLYFTDVGISSGMEEEYFFKKIDKVPLNIYYDSIKIGDEISQKRYFFENLLNFFKDGDAEKYERKVIQHNIRVCDEIKEWFDLQEGSTGDTITMLMNGEMEKPKLNANLPPTDNIIFLLTYSENERWKAISPINDPDRLRMLLF